MKRTPRWLAPLTVTAALMLSSCAVPLPEYTPPPADNQVFPVLDETRLDRVLTSVESTLKEADADAAKGELSPRVKGRAARMRGWEYTLQKVTKKAELEEPYSPQPLSTDTAVSVIAATDDWPRQVMVITDPPEGGNTSLLLVLEQEDARDEYSLMGWVRLLPGVTTPQFDATATGSQQLDADASELLVSPEDAVSQYASVLNDSESKHAKKFAKDPYRKLLADEIKALSDSLEAAGKATQKTKKTGPVYALETFDGGAIVFGAMASEQVYEKTVPRATMKVGSVVAALNDGNATVESEITATYQHMIAFYVPPADADEKIVVLGAERVLSKVE